MIRGKKRPLRTANRMNVAVKCSLHNRFDIEVIDAATGEVKQRAQAENVICDALWTRMFTPASWFGYIHYGTGSGTPASTDTSLFTFLGYGSVSTDTDVLSLDNASGVASFTRKTQIDESTAVGETLTEVGIGYSYTSATLCTHAMLKDMNGNPISIAKTATDIINIYATVFAHFDTDGYDSGYIQFFVRRPEEENTEISESTIYNSSYLLWIFGLGTLSNLFAWFNPGVNVHYNLYGRSDAAYALSKALTPTYTPSTKTLTLTMVRAAVADLNQAAGWGSLTVGYMLPGSSSSSHNITPMGDIICFVGGSWYTGTSITGETVATGDGTTKDFQTAFPLVSDVTVKVDGAEVTSGITVDENKPGNLTQFGYNLKLLKYEYLGSGYPWSYMDVACGSLLDQSQTYKYGSPMRATYYNPYYALGLTTIGINNAETIIEASTDNSTWETVFSGVSGTQSIPGAYLNYPYWRVSHAAAGDQRCAYGLTCPAAATNIHFDTAPADGAIITADYTTKTIAKDESHVFDLTVTITLGEKTT